MLYTSLQVPVASFASPAGQPAHRSSTDVVTAFLSSASNPKPNGETERERERSGSGEVGLRGERKHGPRSLPDTFPRTATFFSRSETTSADEGEEDGEEDDPLPDSRALLLMHGLPPALHPRHGLAPALWCIASCIAIFIPDMPRGFFPSPKSGNGLP